MRIARSFTILLLCIIASVLVARAADSDSPPLVHVGGVVDKPGDWSTEQLKSQFTADMKLIEFTSRGQKHHADCIPLLALLKAAGAQTQITENPAADPKTKNLPLRLVVDVQARDGYGATFSMAELMPQFGNKDAWLAIDLDDKPLSANDGPARLLLPSDAANGRWVRGVASITVIDCSAPTTQPSK